MRTGRTGYTLIELTVVVFIMAVSLMIVFPRLGDLAARQAGLRGPASALAAAARYARERAASTGLRHTLVLEIDTGAFHVTADPGRRRRRGPAPERAAEGRLARGVRFADVRINGEVVGSREIARVCFTPEGSADDASIGLAGPAGPAGSVVIRGIGGRIEARRGPVKASAPPGAGG